MGEFFLKTLALAATRCILGESSALYPSFLFLFQENFRHGNHMYICDIIVHSVPFLRLVTVIEIETDSTVSLYFYGYSMLLLNIFYICFVCLFCYFDFLLLHLDQNLFNFRLFPQLKLYFVNSLYSNQRAACNLLYSYFSKFTRVNNNMMLDLFTLHCLS